MTRLPLPIKCLLLLLLSIPAAGAQAQQSRDFGPYTVYYQAVNSTFISPTIASRYGITRGPRNAFLNIAVRKNTGEGSRAVRSDVSGIKTNLMQQSAPIEFTEVVEGEAIYYIGEFEFSNAEQLRFELSIQPEHQGPVYPLEWESRLYIN